MAYTGTQVDKVVNAFLSKIEDDQWEAYLYEEAKQDWLQLLDAAIGWFKFPRVSLEHDNDNFEGTLNNDEIQILSTYMKCELLNRTVLSWQNIKTLYDERDFSQANMLAQLENALAYERTQALQLEATYYRSVNKKPFDYSRLAGMGDDR